MKVVFDSSKGGESISSIWFLKW